mmetsp:Transcript_19951/g.58261  ORF Transcript_19951/g.58261 Transcript_19951/m.58261 type:complete len:210 (+) Transcript_19951:1345-1974(+)
MRPSLCSRKQTSTPLGFLRRSSLRCWTSKRPKCSLELAASAFSKMPATTRPSAASSMTSRWSPSRPTPVVVQSPGLELWGQTAHPAPMAPELVVQLLDCELWESDLKGRGVGATRGTAREVGARVGVGECDVPVGLFAAGLPPPPPSLSVYLHIAIKGVRRARVQQGAAPAHYPPFRLRVRRDFCAAAACCCCCARVRAWCGVWCVVSP